MSYLGFDHHWKFSLKGNLRSYNYSSIAENGVDAVLFACIAFATACVVVDWLLSKNEKRRIKEAVGDYWTTLQYWGPAGIFRLAWAHSVYAFEWVAGPRALSVRRMLVSIAMYLILAYLTWWLTLTALLATKGISFGPPYSPGIKIYGVWASFPTACMVITWILGISWLGLNAMVQAVRRFEWTKRGAVNVISQLLAHWAVIFAISVAIVLELFGLPQVLDTFNEWVPSGTNITVTGENDVSRIVGAALALFLSGGMKMLDAAITVFFAATLAAVIFGPLLLFLFMLVASFATNLILERARPWLVGPVSRVLERVYESEKGVIAIGGIVVASAVKLIDEAAKRLG